MAGSGNLADRMAGVGGTVSEETTLEDATEPETVISLDEEDDEPAAEPEQGTQPEPERASRRERRQNRYRMAKEEAERARREVEEERARSARLEAQLGQLSQRQMQLEQSVGRGQAPQDPLEAEERVAMREEEAIQREWANLSPDEQQARGDDYRERYRNIQQKIVDVRVKRAVARQQPDPATLANQVRLQDLQNRYSDVVNNPRALNKAQAIYHDAVAAGRPIGADFAEECMKSAREWMRGPRPDVESERRRTTGLSSALGTDSSGKNVVRMNGSMKIIARMQYSDVPPEEAYRKWAKNDYKSYLQNKKLVGG
jgi:hypothetical protein